MSGYFLYRPIRDLKPKGKSFTTNIRSLRDGSFRNQILVEIKLTPNIRKSRRDIIKLNECRESVIEELSEYGDPSLALGMTRRAGGQRREEVAICFKTESVIRIVSNRHFFPLLHSKPCHPER